MYSVYFFCVSESSDSRRSSAFPRTSVSGVFKSCAKADIWRFFPCSTSHCRSRESFSALRIWSIEWSTASTSLIPLTEISKSNSCCSTLLMTKVSVASLLFNAFPKRTAIRMMIKNIPRIADNKINIWGGTRIFRKKGDLYCGESVYRKTQYSAFLGMTV